MHAFCLIRSIRGMTRQETAARTARQEPPQLGEIGLANYAPYLMNRIMGGYNGHIRKDLRAMGLTTTQMRALAVLAVMDGMQIRALAEYAVVEQSTLSRAIDQLQADGLVLRGGDPQDSRAACLSITPEGRRKFEQIWPVMARSYEALFSGIEEAERTAFVATLQKILLKLKGEEE
jgi:DNA-binding MarR family transcriptional regulator